MLITADMVMEALKSVQDPELRLGIVDLGLIYGVNLDNDGKNVEVCMSLTSPGCPYGPQLVNEVRAVALGLPGIDTAEVRVVWDPPWDPRKMASDEIKDKLGLW
ncbi:metal-sulfur cluster assembly factor [Candidatus Pacearchaeota archaeon]|nr:metal-sulfur cluster assembly factor [Candidatus Pacearchaeota archaeon]